MTAKRTGPAHYLKTLVKPMDFYAAVIEGSISTAGTWGGGACPCCGNLLFVFDLNSGGCYCPSCNLTATDVLDFTLKATNPQLGLDYGAAYLKVIATAYGADFLKALYSLTNHQKFIH